MNIQNTNLVTFDIILERIIKDPRGFIVSKIFSPMYLCSTIHDLLGTKSEFVYLPVYYEVINGQQKALLPELILCHSEFEKLNAILIEKNVTRLKIQIIENWQFKYGEQLIYEKKKQSIFSRCKQIFRQFFK